MSDLTNCLDVVHGVIDRDWGIADAWRAVVEQIAPEASVQKHLLSLDVLSDTARLLAWFRRQLTNRPPSNATRGLLFLLYHPERRGQVSTDFSLTACGSFDPVDPAWATDHLFHWEEHPQSEVLHRLYKWCASAADTGNQGLIHGELWYAMLVAASVCRESTDLIPRGPRSGIGIGVCFADSDVFVVGSISTAGLKPGRRLKGRKRSLPKAELFVLEGNQNALLCTVVDENSDRDWFPVSRPRPLREIHVQVDPDWTPHGTGNFGTIVQYGDILPRHIAEAIHARCPQQLELYSVQIQDRPEEWRMLCPTAVIHCADFAESQRRGRLVLLADAIGQRKIFRVKGYYEDSAYIVSREIAQLLLDCNVTGVSFRPIITI